MTISCRNHEHQLGAVIAIAVALALVPPILCGGAVVRHSQVQRTAQYKLAWQAVVTVAQRKIKAGDGGIIYAMTDRMSARLRWGGVL